MPRCESSQLNSAMSAAPSARFWNSNRVIPAAFRSPAASQSAQRRGALRVTTVGGMELVTRHLTRSAVPRRVQAGPPIAELQPSTPEPARQFRASGAVAGSSHEGPAAHSPSPSSTIAAAARARRSSAEHEARCATACPVYSPCRYAPLLAPLGAPLRAPWKRHTDQPLTAGAWHRSRVAWDVAVQRGASCIANLPFMGFAVAAFLRPAPSCHGCDAAHDRLPPFVDGHVLHHNPLLTAGTVTLQRSICIATSAPAC